MKREYLSNHFVGDYTVNVGDIYIRKDPDYCEATYAVISITKNHWTVGPKKIKKMSHSFHVIRLETSEEFSLDSSVFRRHYLDNKHCKKIWSKDVTN